MLSLMIIFMLFGTLLPTMQKMQQILDDKQLRATAFETLHEAAKIIMESSSTAGQRTVNGTVYSWTFESRLCVSYENYRSVPVLVCAE